MNIVELNQLVAACTRDNTAVLLECQNSWNGFTAGNSYQAIVGRTALGFRLIAADDDAIETPIDSDSCVNFVVVKQGLPLTTTSNLDLLRDWTRRLMEPEAVAFQVGDEVIWKDGLGNRNMPGPDAVMVVTAVLAEPIMSHGDNDSGNPYYREPLDVRVATITQPPRRKEKQLVEVYLDSRRLRHRPAEAAE